MFAVVRRKRDCDGAPVGRLIPAAADDDVDGALLAGKGDFEIRINQREKALLKSVRENMMSTVYEKADTYRAPD
jgi:hypothetical protein